MEGGKYSNIIGAEEVAASWRAGLPVEISVQPDETPLVALEKWHLHYEELAREQGIKKIILKARNMTLSVLLSDRG